jgi:hypothetical protein
VMVAVTVTAGVMVVVITGVEVAVEVGVEVGGRCVAVAVGVGGRIISVGVDVGAEATKGSPNGSGTMVNTRYKTAAAATTPRMPPMSFQGILLRRNSSPQWGQTTRPDRIAFLHLGQVELSLRSRVPQLGQTTSFGETDAPHHLHLSIPLRSSWQKHEDAHHNEQGPCGHPNVSRRYNPGHGAPHCHPDQRHQSQSHCRS